MKITSVEITAENVPANLAVSKSGLVSGIPGSIGNSKVPVKAVTNYGEATGSLTVVVKSAEPKLGFHKIDGTSLPDITLSDLKKKIGDGTALSEYGLGADVSLPYTDPFNNVEYSCPFRFGHFSNFTYADGTVGPGLGLVCRYALPSVGVQFDAEEISPADRKTYGNNRYSVSNLRQYMNSTGTNWYKAQHSTDAPPTSPSNWNSVKGLLDCFPASFIDNLSSVQVHTKTADGDGGAVDTVTDTFFVLSVNELGYGAYNSDMVAGNVEGEFWGLYKKLSGYSSVGANSATSAHAWLVQPRISQSGVDAWWFTRSALLSHLGRIWLVSSTGYLTYNGAKGMMSIVPACVLRGA